MTNLSNPDCPYFPCHEGADSENFNCLFCYCPLYVLGEKCGGSFTYTPAGIKDCSACLLPHGPGGYDYVLSRCGEVMDLARRRETP